MASIIVLVIVGIIVGAATLYIFKERKKGIKCIGCPEGCGGGCSGNCSGCNRNCGQHN